ncbi:MAG: MG2 domain-containing protein, partial [Armatimonadaceae bacterium]
MWATDLAKGTPLSGVDVKLVGAGKTAVSGKDGLARIALASKPGSRIEVRRGNDVAFLPASFWDWSGSPWVVQGRGAQMRWFVFDDRGLYKPGETVRVKGWARRQQPGRNGILEIPADIKTITWQLNDPVGNEVRKGSVNVNAWGGFDVKFDLPKTMNLGDAVLTVGGHAHRIQVQEFRRPEIEVTTRTETPAPHVVRGPGIDVAVDAKYYAGGGLAGASANWQVSAKPTNYTPPGREGFTFGEWVPWWRSFAGGEDMAMPMGRGRGFRPFGDDFEVSKEFAGTTDPSGVHRIHIDVDSVRPSRPYSLRAEATVQDVNRQALSSSTALLVHPSERYVGLRAGAMFVDEGKPISVDTLVCDIDGKAVSGVEIRFEAFRREWAWSKGRWAEKEVDRTEWIVRSGKEATTTQFTPKTGGNWRVRATVLDSKERPNSSELTLWVSGGPTEPQRGLEQETVELIPGKKEYAPGETATFLVRAPFASADGLLTVRRNGIVSTERFSITKSTRVLKVKVDSRWIPGATVQVDLTGQAPRSGADGKPLAGLTRPAFASGSVPLNVSKDSLRLRVAATPGERSVEPGGKTSVAIAVTGADGKPVSESEVAVVVVDEAVLALAGWNPGDPLSAFHPAVGPDVNDTYLRSHLLLEDPSKVLEAQAPTSGMVAESRMMVMDAAPGAPGGAMAGRA